MQTRHAFPKAFGMGRGVYVPTIMLHPQNPSGSGSLWRGTSSSPVPHAAGADASHRRGFTCQLAGRSAQLPLPVPERRRGGRLRSYQKYTSILFIQLILSNISPPTPINISDFLIFHSNPYFPSFCIFESLFKYSLAYFFGAKISKLTIPPKLLFPLTNTILDTTFLKFSICLKTPKLICQMKSATYHLEITMCSANHN